MIKPAHAICHRRETARQAIERAPIERKKMKHTGAARPAGKLKGRGFPPSDKPKHDKLPTPGPRPIYAERG